MVNYEEFRQQNDAYQISAMAGGISGFRMHIRIAEE